MASQRILLTTDSLAIGRFFCPPDDARWSRENWIGPDHHVVFPARAVVIEQAGHARLVANPNHAVMYDAGRTYRRGLVSPDGDVATFIVLRERLARELLGESHGGRPASFPRPEVWLDAPELLRLRLLARAIQQDGVDPLASEEAILDMLARLTARSGVTRSGPIGRRKQRRGTREAHAELVEDVKLLLSARLAEHLQLSDIAAEVGASPYHLARIFRIRTGQSIHAYREQLRLRAALDLLAHRDGPHGDAGFAMLASDLGFASHAHFATRFRRAFGCTPAQVRGTRRRPGQMRTIVQGRPGRPS